jgi:hypothetical protein
VVILGFRLTVTPNTSTTLKKVFFVFNCMTD